MLAPMRSILLIGLAALALVATGCGGKKSESDQVRSTWQSALKAVGADDAAKLCSLLTAQARGQISARSHLSCADTVKVLGSQLSPAERTAASHSAIKALTVNGDHATIRFAATPGLQRLGLHGTVTLTKVGGHWLLSGL
jgi:hypothetical protein